MRGCDATKTDPAGWLEPPAEPNWPTPNADELRAEMLEAFARDEPYHYAVADGVPSRRNPGWRREVVYNDAVSEECVDLDGYDAAHAQLLLGNAKPMKAIVESAFERVFERVQDEAIEQPDDGL